ncbi:MAG: HAMP domain-containing sensor histidine kinase [Actinomycetota bacterium]
MSRFGLRARLGAALVGVAVLAVGLATLLGNRGLEPRLEETAQARLQRSADHFAEVSATVRADVGSWPAALPTLAHLAALEDLRAEVRADGEVMRLGGPVRGVRASAPVVSSGRQVATVIVSPASGALYTPEEEHLRHSLDRLHLIAGGVAVAAALLVAFLLAETLTGPLRRLRQTAERMEQGQIDARVASRGAPELAAVGRALNRLSETLEHEEEVRKANAADLAHELRTPVNSLLSRIEAAQDGVLAGPENLAAMHTEVLRLTRLLDDLARLADAERPGLLLDKRPVDLAVAARAVADSFAPRFAESGLAFVVELEPVYVAGDQTRLEQIATNLLSNAFRHTETGEVRLRVAREGDQAVLEVSDTGVGIAPDDLRHIFTRFWRGDRSRSRATGGAGIGLAIVRELVRAHDGRVDVDSTPGKGSRFRVILPAVDAPRSQPVA